MSTIETIVQVTERTAPPTIEGREGWDRFGFIPSTATFEFDGGAIAVADNFTEVHEWVRRHVFRRSNVPSRDRGDASGILFPPESWDQARDCFDGRDRDIPGSTRPASIHRVPASHYLRLDDVLDLHSEREHRAGLVIKLLGFVYDTPAQFHEWWFDGATSIAEYSLLPAHPLHHFSEALSDFMSHSYCTWSNWPEGARRLMIAVLKMHVHAPGYRWEWERFAWEYSVTDGCYKVANLVGIKVKNGNSRPKHGERIQAMANTLGLRFDEHEKQWAEAIVQRRNELLHEASWCGGQTSSGSDDSAYRAPRQLHKFNQRLILGLLGFRCDLLTSSWLTLGRQPLLARGRNGFGNASAATGESE